MKGLAVTLAVSFLVMMVAAYAVYAREKPRPGQEVVVAAQARQKQLHLQLDELNTHPVLSPLDSAWNDVRYTLEACGIEVHPIAPDPSSPEAQRLYSGPVPAWHANLDGKPLALFSCLDGVNQMHSIYIGTFALEDASARASISVLGRLTDKQWSSP